MLRILFTVQCDVCGDFFQQVSTCNTANQNACAILAGDIIEAAQEDGWYFNGKTRQFWCVDCIMDLSYNSKMPDVSIISLPFTKSSSGD
ncbi:MAG: hypothetical protein K8F91_02445 [Candidatus Obscuribacterales bacterium]|nr:hypothetical protein [Candidatus Obscuribacterales bacterium]